MSVSAPKSPRSTPAWKSLLALLSLVLSGLLWLNGLVDSLQRPSVGNALALRQLELSVLAAPALPAPLKGLLGGVAPATSLREELEHQIDQSEAPAPPAQVLELALLVQQAGDSAKASQLFNGLMGQVSPQQRPLIASLAAPSSQVAPLLAGWILSPLQQQLVCDRLNQLGTPASAMGPCAAANAGQRQAALHHNALLRLLGLSAAPVLFLFLGSGFLLRDLWQRWRHKAPPLAELVGPPLDLVDVTLLVAGGFVVCGELLTPLVLAPVLQNSLGFLKADPALQQAVAVLGMYLGLMSLPLLILWSQLRGKVSKPEGGWLQWRWRPLASALRQALLQVLKVLPLVTLVGWLFDQLVSKASGSNPLLELVLTTTNPWALLLFSITAMVLAPLFEETLFRGVLLPVLGQRYGGLWGVVISALVFGIAHLSLGELPALFVLGLGLGWLRLQSGRLGPSVLMHGLWNGLTSANLLLLAG
uniref:lysostaphin resistance A-like protein n=1 Tax=Cyanobium sp. TaxID=2164130 RepID=UPI00404AC9E0